MGKVGELGLGTGRVLGSVLPAQDEAVLVLMTELYRRLAAGGALAAALAAAQVPPSRSGSSTGSSGGGAKLLPKPTRPRVTTFDS